jgi:molecular chaperone GrpE
MSEGREKDWKKFKEDNAVEEETERADEGDANQSLEHLSYEEIAEKLTLSEQTAHENWEKAVRALAELDNVRRRSEREVQNAHRYSLEKFANGLLPVVDSLEQALQLADKSADAAMHEGLSLTMKLFLDVLEKFDVKQIDPLGEPFNPEQHEAMSMQESPDAMPNSVLMVFQKGYKLNDRMIRPARVIVAK